MFHECLKLVTTGSYFSKLQVGHASSSWFYHLKSQTQCREVKSSPQVESRTQAKPSSPYGSAQVEPNTHQGVKVYGRKSSQLSKTSN
ncbi:hypothetical protein PM082_005326 [Marasmius tenuissimus]|nr:hypothetical protein PM082_005326 [Marasmius tenuissimus]